LTFSPFAHPHAAEKDSTANFPCVISQASGREIKEGSVFYAVCGSASAALTTSFLFFRTLLEFQSNKSINRDDTCICQVEEDPQMLKLFDYKP